MLLPFWKRLLRVHCIRSIRRVDFGHQKHPLGPYAVRRGWRAFTLLETGPARWLRVSLIYINFQGPQVPKIVKARQPLRTAYGPRGCFRCPKSTPRRLLMQWTRRRCFQKGKSTVTVRTVRGLQGMVWCPKPTPSAAGETLQCRAGGAPVRRSEEIRRRSKALDLPDVRISRTRMQSATHRYNRSNAL